MKLYYAKGACSLAPHIALCENKLKFDLVNVDLKNKKTENDEDFLKINAKGYVPVLQLNDNEILTECAVILQYIASKAPTHPLSDPQSFESYRFKEWLNFIATEMHKGVGNFFKKNINDELKQEILQGLIKRFQYLEDTLSKHPFLMGETFSVVDAYLFTILRWVYHFKIDLTPYARLGQYFERVKERPAVQEALRTEGLA